MKAATNSISLAQEMVKLLEEQKLTWPLLRDNYINLEKVKTKIFRFDGCDITVQYNPARIVSSSAEVSKQAIEARPCFLCERNLPAEQKILRFNSSFNILCNPYPIFNRHYTITKDVHELQSIQRHFSDFLKLAREAEESFTILYNGPKCGASAPDHLHFQAAPFKAMPIENNLPEIANRYTKKFFRLNETECRLIDDSMRKFVFLSSAYLEPLVAEIKRVYDALKDITRSSEEPMLNMISSFINGRWQVIIFPRGKHRPDQYFAEGDGRLLISPAVVDLGGLLIVPRKEDFEKISAEIIIDIFRQVFIDDKTFESLSQRILS